MARQTRISNASMMGVSEKLSRFDDAFTHDVADQLLDHSSVYV